MHLPSVICRAPRPFRLMPQERGGSRGGAASPTGFSAISQAKQDSLAGAWDISAALPEARVVKQIGQGAHGQVFQALWRGQQVAIKVVQHEVKAPTRQLGLCSEAAAAAAAALPSPRAHAAAKAAAALHGADTQDIIASGQRDGGGGGHETAAESKSGGGSGSGVPPRAPPLSLDENDVRLFEGMVGLSAAVRRRGLFCSPVQCNCSPSIQLPDALYRY